MTQLIANYKDFIGNGSKDTNGNTLEEFLLAYDPYKYKTPSVTADIVVIKESDVGSEEQGNTGLQVLLIKRKNHPCIGQWALPGGFAEEGETLEQSAKRELEEETGVTGVPVVQLHTWGDPDRDPRGRVITVSYLAYLEKEVTVTAGDDAKEAEWVEINKELLRTEYEQKDGEKTRCRRYELRLSNTSKSIELSAVIEERTAMNRRLEQSSYEILGQTGIAFDHAKVLLHALLEKSL